MLIPVWAFFLAGYWRSISVSLSGIGAHIRMMLVPRGSFWLSFVSFSLLMGAVYIINQIVDRESDRVNQKLFLIPLGIVPVKLAIIMVVVLVAVSLGMGWTFGIWYLVLLCISLIVGVLYSVPPLRLKGRPVVDIISNAAGYGVLAFGIGWITRDCLSLDFALRLIPYFFAAATIFTASTVLDREGDRADGALTTAVTFGITPTLMISLVTLFVALGSGIVLRDYIILVTSVVGLPLIIIALIRKKRQFVTLYMRGTSYVFILLVAAVFPWFLVLLVCVFMSSKLYYRLRFGITYPALLEKEA
jgi:chlorophyll synthase